MKAAERNHISQWEKVKMMSKLPYTRTHHIRITIFNLQLADNTRLLEKADGVFPGYLAKHT